jgi:nicotinamidase-related amidase
MLYILGSLIIIVGFFIARAIITMKKNRIPTQGLRINCDDRSNMALIIIDMQQDFIENFSLADAEEKILKINILSQEAQKKGEKIIHIKHVHAELSVTILSKIFMKGAGAVGSKGLNFVKSITANADAEFYKSKSCAFSSPEFLDYLAQEKIGRITLTGLDGCYCVNSTARGALNLGFETHLIEDAILTSHVETWEKYKVKLKSLGAKIS